MYVSIQDTVVCEQANQRSDIIRQIIYKDEEQDDPWITLGLDLRLDYLKLLVECAETVTYRSTLSHNYREFLHTMWNLVKGLNKIHNDQICLLAGYRTLTLCNVFSSKQNGG